MTPVKAAAPLRCGRRPDSGLPDRFDAVGAYSTGNVDVNIDAHNINHGAQVFFLVLPHPNMVCPSFQTLI